MVRKQVEMRVVVNMPDGTKVFGKWQFWEPHFWNREQSEFHKNGSSWCANNFVDDLANSTLDEITKLYLEKVANDSNDRTSPALCLCHSLTFQWVRIISDAPKRELRA